MVMARLTERIVIKIDNNNTTAKKGAHVKLQTTKTSSSAALFCFVTAAAIVGTLLQQTDGRAIEVQERRTPSGDICFFVEHDWHGILSGSTIAAGTTNILFNNLIDGTSKSRTSYPDGVLNNKSTYDGDANKVGWGCINDETPTLIGTSCHYQSNDRKSTFQ